MNLTKILIIVGVLLSGGLLLWWLTRKSVASNPTDNGSGKGTDRPGATKEDGTPEVVTTSCFEVPASFPPFNDQQVPTSILDKYVQTARGDQQLAAEKRVRGFFKALDTEVAAYVIDYFGVDRFRAYLASPDGMLPHEIVVKGSHRCAIKSINML